MTSTRAPSVLPCGRDMPSDQLPGLLEGFPDWLTTGLIVAAAVLLLAPILPLLVVAPLLAIRARGATQQAGASRDWPSVVGSVVSVGIESRPSSSRDGSISYYPRIAYSYAVQGREYQGHRLAADGTQGFDKPELAQAAADGYLPGHPVRVYYDPANPGAAVLERAAPAVAQLRGLGVFAGLMLVMLAVVGAAILAFPIWLIVRLFEFSFP